MPQQLNKGRADRVIAFINQLPIVDGPAVGQRFVVEPWQEEWLRSIYEPHDEDGHPVVRRAALSVARKNAKSYLVSGMLLAHLVGPEAVPNGQIASAAVDREQAAVIFHMCRKMIEATPLLQRYLSVVPSTKTIFVRRTDCKGRGSSYQALSSETGSKHGKGLDFFVYDEFGEARNGELWDVLFDSQQTRTAPLAVAISTQNNDPQHPFSIMLDDGLTRADPTLVTRVFAAKEGCDLLDEAGWLAANPTLATWKSIKPIRTAAEEAMRLPSKESNFRRRYLNQRVSPHSSLIAKKNWDACAGDVEFEEGEGIYLGLDLSMKTDLTALVAISDGDKSRAMAWFWKPLDYLEEHAKRDRQPYDVWHREGHLIAPEGAVVDLQSVARKIAELSERYIIKGLAYDRYGMANLMSKFEDIGLYSSKEGAQGGVPMHDWGQGFRDMTPALDALEEEILKETLVHPRHPLLTMCMAHAIAIMDPAGNRKLDKSKTRLRIDGAQALAMAVGLKARLRQDHYVPENPFEDPNFDLRTLMT